MRQAVGWLRLVAWIVWLGVFVAWPRLTMAISLVAVGGAFVAFNAWVFWQRQVRGDDAPAVAPIVGGLFAAAGVALLPLPGAWKWAWMPLLVDWGGLPMLAVAGWRALSKGRPAADREREG